MVCQKAPSPPSPTEPLYTVLPHDLPARWVPYQVFVLHIRHRIFCIPMSRKFIPHIQLSLPLSLPEVRVAATEDVPNLSYIRVEIIGWRWALADTRNPSVDIFALGLNRPGVPNYDRERNRWGEFYSDIAAKELKRMKEAARPLTVGVKLERKAKAYAKRVEKRLDKVAWWVWEKVHDREERKRLQAQGLWEPRTVLVDLDIEDLIRQERSRTTR